ncbi:MAG TPA: dynamin family protein [Rhodothermales bacterium]|nr:dynamin family protein [Rhodothermales bacterium]
MALFVDQKFQAHRTHIEEIVKDLHNLASDIGYHDLRQTVSDLRNRIHEPFMFVIVGEVKAGKSSFINALLEAKRDVCKVAPSPCTDTVQQILFGEREEVVVVNEHLKKIFTPEPILQEIAIVDTPGTNTIVAHHQEITERFIPASDLIVFVFESKNPYRQSAWDFFDFIHSDWRKKIIFVLQQKDLMNEADLTINKQGVVDYAAKKGIVQPVVFTASAKQEQEGLVEESGFAEIRAYIRENITGGKAPYLKLRNNISTSQNINDKIAAALAVRVQQYEADVVFRADIRETLESQSRKSIKQVAVLSENLLAGYDQITRRVEHTLEEGLSFFTLLKRSVSSIFDSGASPQAWIKQLSHHFEQDLQSEMRRKLEEGVGDIADQIQTMARLVDMKIKNSQTILKNNHEIFSDIAERRSTVLADLQSTFTTFLSRSENFRADGLGDQNASFSPNIATGSGLAIIGVILATVTQGAILDITGGLLTTMGLLFAGVTVGLKRRRIMDEFREEVAKGRTQLEKEVHQRLNSYINTLKDRIDANFDEFDALLELEGRSLALYTTRQKDIRKRLDDLDKAF